MANTFTANLGLIQPGINDQASTNLWGGYLNTDMSLLDTSIAGYLSLSVAGNSNVILTSAQGQADQSRTKNFRFTGVLTGNITVFFPQNMTRDFSVYNNTTGAFTLTIAVNNGSGSPAGATVSVPQGGTIPLASDGTNIVQTVTTQGLGNSGGGVVGDSRKATMAVTTAAATATFTADQIIVATANAANIYSLINYSQAINLATTGPGGMDTGSAPVNGYVSLYAIYNPTSFTASILACNVTTSSNTIYSGANAPAGYTASALIGIVPTNGSSQFQQVQIVGRHVSRTPVNEAPGATPLTWTTTDISTSVPPTAVSVDGYVDFPTVGGGTYNYLAAYGQVGTSNLGIGQIEFGNITTSGNLVAPFYNLQMTTAQTLYYRTNNTAVLTIYVNGYTF